MQKILQATGCKGQVRVHWNNLMHEYQVTVQGDTGSRYFTSDLDDAYGTAAHMAGFFDVSVATHRAVKKYGAEACLRAAFCCDQFGEGPSTGLQLWDLRPLQPIKNVQAMDAVINAGRELSALYQQGAR